MTTTVDSLEPADVARVHRAYGQEHRRLHPAVWRELQHSGLAGACLPASLGGTPLPVPGLLAAITELAAADASAGWVAAITGPAGLFAALLPHDAARALLSAAAAGQVPFLGGSSHPAGIAEAAPGGGYQLSGRWPLVTGARRLHLCFLAARLGADGEVRWCAVPREAVEVEDDWRAHGLQATDSVTVHTRRLHVPAEHLVDLTTNAPTEGDDPLSAFPRYGLMAAALAAAAVGAAHAAVDRFAQVAGRHRPRGAAGVLGQQGHVHEAAARAQGRLESADTYLTHTATQAWEAAHHGRVDGRLRAALRLAACEAADAARVCAHRLFQASGSAGVYEAGGLAAPMRDLDVMAQHALLGPAAAQRAGRYLLTGDCPKDL
ncbi:acyl-CoA dehydrogenase family protein [Streptomyces sp. NPDC021100]|uniref:acyl-CoA dehydrogenase family protein n=1 Tax=Streptomyces sp. NPDC021100 TaxID=3365114 RepID=UPI0037A271F2